MKLSDALASLLLITASGGAGAFAPHQKTTPSWNRARSTRIMMSTPPPEGGSRIPSKKVLTAADVIGKAKAQGSLPGQDGTEEYPKLFTEDIYDDFQSALLKLEKRVKEGPGALSAEEIDAFEGETQRIVEEMKLYLNNPEERKKEIAKTYGAVASSGESKVEASTPAPATIPPPAPVATQPLPPPVASTPAPVTPAPESSGYGVTDTSLDEGPAFDGKSYGLAKGTANTYMLPGMEEMSPEEYRAKLQESISARQALRREESLKTTGKIGNANSQSYLDGLSNKGENVVSDVDISLSSSSSSSVHAADDDPVNNECRAADEIISKTEEDVTKDEDSTEAAEAETDKTEAEPNAEAVASHAKEVSSSKKEKTEAVSQDEEKQSSKVEKQNIVSSKETQSGLKAVVMKIEKSKAEKDVIRLSEWQVSTSSGVVSEKSGNVKVVEESERYSLGQSSGYFVRNDDTPRQNPILGIDPSKKYAKVQDRTGSTTQRTISTRVETVFDRNSVGAIRKSPLKSQATAKSLAESEMDQIQRPVRGSESPNYQTVSDRTTRGDLRKNKPLSSTQSAVSLVESEQRLRPTPGTELPNYHKIEDRRSVGDMRKSGNTIVSSTSISSLVGSENRQRPTPRTQLSTQSATDVKTFAGDLRKSSNKPLPASSSRMSLVQEEKRTRPVPSSDLPSHAQVRDRRSVGDFRDPATKKSLSSPTSLIKDEVRERPTPSAGSRDMGVSDSRGVVFKTKASDFSVNAASSLIADEVQVRQRPDASTNAKEKDIVDSRGVIFKTSDSKSQQGKSQPQSPSSLIADEVRQRPIASQTLKDTSASTSDSRGIIFKTSTAKSQSQSTTAVKSQQGKSQSQSPSSLITDEVRQRPIASQTVKDTIASASDSRGIIFKTSATKPQSQSTTSAVKSQPQSPSSLIADEVRQRPIAPQTVKDTIASASDSRGIVFKTAPSSSTVPSSTSLIEDEKRERKPATTDVKKFVPVQDRTGDARVATKKSTPPPAQPKPAVVDKQTRPPRASSDPRKYARVENRVGPDVRRAAKEKAATVGADGEESQWWHEKTQRPRAIPSKKPEALQRDTQTQSTQVRTAHMKEEKRRREQEPFQTPIAELQPSSLKALVKEDRHDEEEKHNQPPPLKMLLNSDRPIAGVKEDPPKAVTKESHLNSLLKDEVKGELHEKRQQRPPDAGDEWWNEKPNRPKGYVKHSQPINTTYENRDSHLRDYGDVVNQPGSDSTDEEDVDDEDIP